MTPPDLVSPALLEIWRKVRAEYPELFERNRRARIDLLHAIYMARGLAALPARPACPSFVFSSRLVAASFAYCTSDAHERMHFVLGLEEGEKLVATELSVLPYAGRSVVHARTDDVQTFRLSIAAHEDEHFLFALVHSHPGRGPNATWPSSIDWHTQRRWEAGRRFVSGVWSRDGYIRFFASAPFEVRIAGAHVEQLESNLFRLQARQARKE